LRRGTLRGVAPRGLDSAVGELGGGVGSTLRDGIAGGATLRDGIEGVLGTGDSGTGGVSGTSGVMGARATVVSMLDNWIKAS
jgi:hypothetical protein